LWTQKEAVAFCGRRTTALIRDNVIVVDDKRQSFWFNRLLIGIKMM